MYFSYSENVPQIKDFPTKKELLIATYSFGCWYLKLHGESTTIREFLRVDHVTTTIFFGVAHSCTLLKEIGDILFVPKCLSSYLKHEGDIKKWLTSTKLIMSCKGLLGEERKRCYLELSSLANMAWNGASFIALRLKKLKTIWMIQFWNSNSKLRSPKRKRGCNYQRSCR